MSAIWTAEGLDPFALFMYFFDHPVGTFVGTLTFAWAGIAISGRVPLSGLSSGRNGAKDADKELPNKRAENLERIRKNDPNFEPEAFLKRALAAYAAVDDGIVNRDLSRARVFMSDGVHERFQRQMDEREERGLRERLSELRLERPEALGYLAGPRYDAVYVSFKGAVREELVSLTGDIPVSGGREDFIEVWTFLRRPGAKTLAHPGPIEGCCPSCGATLKIVDSAQCPACRIWVNSGEHDWVLAEITQFAAWAFPDPDREVGGWKALSAADPDLSVAALEDRASLIFWRWLDARRRGDKAPLAGVATDEFLRAMTLDGRFDREAVVAGVETTACERGAEFDRVHIQVSWVADQLRRAADGAEPEFHGRANRTFFFILHRRSGALTDAKAGLRADRCPSCGAAPSARDIAVCSYCQHPFNDGSISWVLTEVVPFGRWKRPV